MVLNEPIEMLHYLVISNGRVRVVNTVQRVHLKTLNKNIHELIELIFIRQSGQEFYTMPTNNFMRFS